MDPLWMCGILSWWEDWTIWGRWRWKSRWHHIRDQQHRQDTLRRIRGCWRRLTDLYGNEPIWIDVWTRLRPRLLYRRLRNLAGAATLNDVTAGCPGLRPSAFSSGMLLDGCSCLIGPEWFLLLVADSIPACQRMHYTVFMANPKTLPSHWSLLLPLRLL